jgi:shikimate kinase
MSKKKIITIVGLMGAGKTTIGSRLAQILKYYFIDSDQEIEDSEHRSIADIFAQNGEKYFREIEAKTIQEIVNRDEEMVLSLGGGAFINQETRKILKQKTLIIWLHASIEETLKRINSKSNRPLLNQKNKRQVLEELAKIRYPIYREADFDFDTTYLTHEDLVEKIINNIQNFKNVQ